MTISKSLFATAAIVTLAGLTSAQFTSETIANNYTDIAGTGASIIGGIANLDDGGVATPIGFSFDFYGTTFTGINVTTNGYLTTGTTLNDFTPECLGVDEGTNSLIAPFWADLRLNEHGDILTETAGAPGSQVTTIQWEDCGGFQNSLASYNFQVKLYEGSNEIEFHYGTINGALNPSDGSDAVVGIENDDATESAQVSCLNAVDLTSGYHFFEPAFQPPSLSAGASACINGALTFTPSGSPFHLYILGADTATVPTYSIFGASFDLNPNRFLVSSLAIGFFDATGDGAPVTVTIPSNTPCGATGFSQLVSIGSFGPIGTVQSSAVQSTSINACQIFNGTLDVDDLTSDLYSLSATAGDVITMTLCRFEDPLQPGSGVSLLDPRLCVYDSAMPVVGSGTGLINNDDTLGDCFVTGPFGASIIEDWTVPATDVYTLAASAWNGSEGPYELSVMGCTGAVTLIGDEVAGGCFN